MVDIKSQREIELMKEACKLAFLTHEEIKKHIKPGISTMQLDKIAEKFILDNFVTPILEEAIERGYTYTGDTSKLANFDDYKAEFLSILDRMEEFGMNTLYFQI